MSAINFLLQNPDATPANAPVLYLGQANTLQVVFSCKSTLNLGPKDVFTLLIPSKLIASADARQLVNTDWIVKITPPKMPSAPFQFDLSPKTTITFTKTLTLSFSNLQGINKTDGEIGSKFLVGGRRIPGTTQQLSVENPPNMTKDLTQSITFEARVNCQQSAIENEKIYISPVDHADNHINPVIFNRIDLNLKFNQNANNLVDHWDTQQPPTFTFRFPYGSSDKDLTDDLAEMQPIYNALTTARNIMGSIMSDENNLWTIKISDSNSSLPTCWTVQPTQNNKHLFSVSENILDLDIIFDHVVSRLPPVNTTLSISWSNIPGFNDGSKSLDLQKYSPKPKIVNFAGKDGQKEVFMEFGNPIILNWETFAASSVQLTWIVNNVKIKQYSIPVQEGKGLTNIGSLPGNILPVSPDSSFTLRALNVNQVSTEEIGPIIVHVNNFRGPSIKNFEGTIIKESSGDFSLLLDWLVTDAVFGSTFCMLDGDPNKYIVTPENGGKFHLKIPLSASSPLKDKYILHASDPYTDLKVEQAISIDVPTELRPSVTMEITILDLPKLKFSWLAKNIGSDGYCLFDGDTWPGYTGMLEAPLNMANSMRHKFTVTAKNVALNKEASATAEAPWKDRLYAGEALESGQFIRSKNSQYTLVFQGDGNLVVYGPPNRLVLFSSGSDGKGGTSCVFQGDGNLVIYGPNRTIPWASGILYNDAAVLVMEGDGIYEGNCVIYDIHGGFLGVLGLPPI